MTETHSQIDPTPVADLIEDFKKGALLRHFGMFLEEDDIVTAGWNQYIAAIRKLDTKGPGARDVLIPLLSDDDPGIRITACIFLLKTHPDLAEPVLYDISRHGGDTEAWITANSLKINYMSGFLDDLT